MLLCVPDGGSFDWFSHTGFDTVTGSHAAEPNPTAADVDEALTAMAAGYIEYVLLDAEDGSFVQSAGEGDSGFVLERWDGGDMTWSRTASRDEVRAALLEYLGG